MIAAWMLYSVIVSVLLCVAAGAADRLCAALRVPRRWPWLAAMALSLVWSAVAFVDLVTRDPQVASLEAGGIVRDKVAYADASSGAIAPVAPVSDVLQATYAFVARMDDATALLLWVVITTALIGIVAVTVLRLRRLRATWRTHRIGDTSVLVSRDTGPALIGVRAPSIVLPAWLLLETDERQRLIVQHEVEHLRARDHLALAASCIAACLLPWNAALWWLLRRTRLAVEVDCDARVLRNGAAAAAYGELLLDVTGRTRTRPLAVPALADSRTHLERRLIAMTEPRRHTNPVRATGAAVAAGLMIVAACTTELPTASALEQMDVEEVESRADLIGLPSRVDGGEPLFVVDGVRVDRVEAINLSPEEIGSIEVVKGAAALERYGPDAANGVVLVETREGVERELVLEQYARVRADRSADLERMIEVRPDDGVHGTLKVQAGELELAPGTKPLIILDGEIVESAQLKRLTPDRIERVELLKTEAARKVSDDPRAAKGVIRITSRKDGSH